MISTAVASLLAMAALAGCMGGSRSENKAGENDAPNADLKVHDNTGWTTETFSFDPRGSTDDDGEIVTYKFDFGDGQTQEYDAQSTDREIDHIYLEGGEYTVTLTVTDDGGDNAGALTSTDDVRVAVNQRSSFEGTVLYAGEGTQQGKFEWTTPANRGADRMESQVEITSTLLAGSSEFKIELKDPSNDTLETKTLTISAGNNATETLRATVTDEGIYRVVITAMSGGGAISGENRLYYDVGFTG